MSRLLPSDRSDSLAVPGYSAFIRRLNRVNGSSFRLAWGTLDLYKTRDAVEFLRERLSQVCRSSEHTENAIDIALGFAVMCVEADRAQRETDEIDRKIATEQTAPDIKF